MPHLLLAINDLRVYGAAVAQPTGMQRVAAGLAAALVAEHGAIPVVVDEHGARSTTLPATPPGAAARAAVPLLGLLARMPRGTQELVRRIARIALARGTRGGGTQVPIDVDDWIAVIGAPWIAPGMADAVIAAKQRDDARIALLVHDLLPATSPRWFADAQGRAAQHDIEALIAAADAIFAVSPAVAAEIAQRYRRSAHPLPPADPLFIASPEPLQPHGERIVLAVGTLHPRKNYAALVSVWEEWAARSSAPNVPRLVIAGRRHPQDHELFDALKSARHARNRITLVHGASDAQLAALYAQARFVVLPSLAEGWGLPVREAFGAGRPVVATDAVPAAIGSPFAAVVPAGDVRALAAKIESWWSSKEPERLSAALQRDFHPRIWGSVANELAAALKG